MRCCIYSNQIMFLCFYKMMNQRLICCLPICKLSCGMVPLMNTSSVFYLRFAEIIDQIYIFWNCLITILAAFQWHYNCMLCHHIVFRTVIRLQVQVFEWKTVLVFYKKPCPGIYVLWILACSPANCMRDWVVQKTYKPSHIDKRYTVCVCIWGGEVKVMMILIHM